MPHESVTKTQIRSLFSTFATQLKNGTLKRPTKKSTEKSDDMEENNPYEIEAREEHDGNYYIDLAAEVQHVMSEFSDWDENYVAVHKEHSWYPGKITKLQVDGRIEVSNMTYVDAFANTNKFFVWSGSTTSDYARNDLLFASNEQS